MQTTGTRKRLILSLTGWLTLTGASEIRAEAPSVCHGTTSAGRLENGWRLPASGNNFEAYTLLGVAAGRTFVHSKVHEILLESWSHLETSAPGKRFVYGETGFREGGKFSPHKTHQNGLSVDFFVPVTDSKGRSVTLPANALNKLGYDIEFDARGRYRDYAIDYDAMALHLLELKKAADKHGVKIWRVIFDPVLQKGLFSSVHGKTLANSLFFPKAKPWVRHDEHYHIDFVVPCR